LKPKDILRLRIINQGIAGAEYNNPADVVHSLGAMQAQDYKMAKWAVGLRMPGITENNVERAYNAGEILRTHILRPTWHFVTPGDIRLIHAATADRVRVTTKTYLKLRELDRSTMTKSMDIITKALEGKNYLTRKELQEELSRHKIIADGSRLAHIIIEAELDMLVCSGPMKGKQFTYSLFDERVPKRKPVSKQEAIASLAAIYFKSRGPATIKDFCWWSSLTINEALCGINDLGNNIKREFTDGQECYYYPESLEEHGTLSAPLTFLMPDYDEYFISYKDRGILLSDYNVPLPFGSNGRFPHLLIINGIGRGIYKTNSLEIVTDYFRNINKTEFKSVQNAVKNYQAFYSK
jgi:hypothetical protein